MDADRIALVSVNPVMGDFAGNREKLRLALARAAARGAGLVVFPELALCGYPPEVLLYKRTFLRANEAALADLAAATQDGPPAVVGFARLVEGKPRNAAAWLAGGHIAAVYDKRELPNYGVFDEKRYFSPGAAPIVMTWQGRRVGLTLCEDAWVPGNPVSEDLRGSTDLILNLAASPFHAGKGDERLAQLSRFARETGAPVVYVNLLGGQDELVFDGGALAVDAGGNLLGAGPRFTETPWIVPVPGTGADFPKAPPALDRLGEIRRALETGLRDYVRKNGFDTVVIGLSGGIDSAFTAVLAARALGAAHVKGVTMPSQYSSAGTREDARLLAANLGVELMTVPIEGMMAAFRDVLDPLLGSGEPGTALENLQARIRGTILMTLSNRHGWLVVTTGNKSETAVGYCTLYGDMAGGFAPIKDVPKTLVYQLAERVNAEAGSALIPERTLRRAPSAELRPGQRDEDALPPYERLDPVLEAYVEQDRGLEEMIAAGFDGDTVLDVMNRVDHSEYKRRQSPPGVKITPRAFGRDRRLPVTNRFHPAGYTE